MAKPYIPAADAAFLQWLTAFVAYVVANKAALNVSASEATLLQTMLAAYQADMAAHQAAINAAHSARAQKDSSRGDVEGFARQLVNGFQADPAITPTMKEDMNVTVRDTSKTPQPAPSVVPALLVELGAAPLTHVVRAINPADPTRRAKPDNVDQWQFFCKLGGAAPTDVNECFLAETTGRDRITRTYAGADVNKVAWYLCRGINRRGEPGPTGAPVSAVIVSVAAAA